MSTSCLQADSILKKGTQVTAVGLSGVGGELNGRTGAVHTFEPIANSYGVLFGADGGRMWVLKRENLEPSAASFPATASPRAIDIASSSYGTSACLTEDGTVFTWGLVSGQCMSLPVRLALPEFAEGEAAVSVATNTMLCVVVTSHGRMFLYTRGVCRDMGQMFPGRTAKIAQLVLTDDQIVVIDQRGELFVRYIGPPSETAIRPADIGPVTERLGQSVGAESVPGLRFLGVGYVSPYSNTWA